ncbi:MAG: hypothetical protein ABI760_21830 [Ferruginibacter sp.]
MCQADNLSIVNTIVDLQSRGFYYDFCFVNDKIFCAQQKQFLSEDEFNILEMYRFPCYDTLMHETVIYGIESSQYVMKGILLNSFRGHVVTVPPIIVTKVNSFWAKQK